MNNFKGIIFDLGGVIEKIAPAETIEAFRSLGIAAPETIFNINRQDMLVDHFEIGKITEAEFFSSLQNSFKIRASYAEIHRSWCAMLIGISKETLAALKELRKKYKLYLLSNTNQTHYQKINESIGFELESLFDQSFFSFIEGKRKPDIALFENVINAINIDPKDLVYIDDLEKNINAAKAVELNTILYQTNYPLPDFLLQGGFLAS